jgi:hypothetical protein
MNMVFGCKAMIFMNGRLVLLWVGVCFSFGDVMVMDDWLATIC